MSKISNPAESHIKVFYDETVVMLDIAERLNAECKPKLCGRSFFTDTQLAEKLNISKRALQDYRDKGLISYYRLDGKILYSDEDVDEFLKSSYRPRYV